MLLALGFSEEGLAWRWAPFDFDGAPAADGAASTSDGEGDFNLQTSLSIVAEAAAELRAAPAAHVAWWRWILLPAAVAVLAFIAWAAPAGR